MYVGAYTSYVQVFSKTHEVFRNFVRDGNTAYPIYFPKIRISYSRGNIFLTWKIEQIIEIQVSKAR